MGRHHSIVASSAGHKSVAQLLLDKGAKMDAANKDGGTPLHWASRQGHDSVVRLLLDNDRPTGTFNPTSGGSAISSCLSCQAGYDSGQTGKSVCDACNAGMFRGVVEEYQRAMAITPYCRSLVSYGVVHYKTMMFYNHNL